MGVIIHNYSLLENCLDLLVEGGARKDRSLRPSKLLITLRDLCDPG